ncbi:helix-turn-helix transcriptional regulator [Anaerolineales bacterium HSG6]|nr:helix-turn-helix transcriptional regulator [Anaerolineales bacterium HSG6]MDM8531269.1 helix-turn-helix transcriptional regulator [Anaerolineales bacterium HSG25]
MIKFKLKELMAEKGLTYRQLSEQSNVSTSVLYKMIQNTGQSVQTDILERLCLALDCTFDDLMKIEADE